MDEEDLCTDMSSVLTIGVALPVFENVITHDTRSVLKTEAVPTALITFKIT